MSSESFFSLFFILKKIESATCLKQESGARLGKVVASFPHREHHRLHRILVRTCNREGEKRKERRQGEECELVCKCDKFLMFREETGVGGIEILRRYDDSKKKEKGGVKGKEKGGRGKEEEEQEQEENAPEALRPDTLGQLTLRTNTSA